MTDTKTATKSKQKITTSPEKKKRGNPDYLPFIEAREYIRTEMIESKGNFDIWWDRTKPKTIPRFPHRAYERTGWVSWNDFLGNNNVFVKKKVAKWRRWDDALLWVHTLRIQTHTEWMDFAKTDNMPSDIPHRPDLAYPKWTSWNHWLGNKPSERAKAAIENQGIFYIICEQGMPSNVLTYGVEPGGLHTLRQRWDRDPYTIIKFFKHQRDKLDDIQRIINGLTTEYHGHVKQRITPNIWEVLWRMQMLLESVLDSEIRSTTSPIVKSPLAGNQLLIDDDLMPVD